MPFSPSDLPFWAWLIAAVICGALSFLVGWGAAYVMERRDVIGGFVFSVIALVSGLAALGALLLGLVRFVKWAWEG